MSDINTLLISGKVGYREPTKFWREPESGRLIPFISFLLDHDRINGRGVEERQQYRVTIWDISDSQEACLNKGTRVLLQGQLKARRLGQSGTGVLTAEITVKANLPGAITFMGQPDTLPLANLPDLLRQLGVDLPPGLDQDLVARAKAAMANPAPPVHGPTPEMQTR
jgi:hypothetical protein